MRVDVCTCRDRVFSGLLAHNRFNLDYFAPDGLERYVSGADVLLLGYDRDYGKPCVLDAGFSDDGVIFVQAGVLCACVDAGLPLMRYIEVIMLTVDGPDVYRPCEVTLDGGDFAC